MTNPSTMPTDLRHAFRRAIGAYSSWRFGEYEPEVCYLQSPTAISFICDLVQGYQDPMPADIWLLLASLTTTRSEEPPTDQSFGSGAHFLQKLIRDKQHRFNLMDQSI
jgi:hypothetical protein